MNDFKKRYAAARRAVIARDLRRLNPMQREAAMTTEGPLLLLAGAGSGKTTVLIQRVYTLLTYGRGSDTDFVPEWAGESELDFLERFPEDPSPEEQEEAVRLCAVDVPRPWEIIAITFTNKAAGELKNRLADRLGPVANEIWASTFHSACVRILRRFIDRLGFDKDFTIYDSDDSKRVIKDVLKSLDIDEKALSPREVLGIISRSKDQYEGAEQFAARYAESGDWKMNRTARVFTAYQERLRSANALDFDDIIFHTVTLLRQEQDVREFYQRKFRYVLVDEYQDTNHMQYLLTGLLAGGWENLCVVGDDDQSIYRFRGANIENILSFEQQYPGAKLIRLEQNYRSTQNILDGANAVIRNNENRKGKTLWTDKGSGDPITVKTTFNEMDEANYVVGDIVMGVHRGWNFRDSAVLYRTNAQSNALEYALKRNGIPYKVIGGMKFFDRAEVKDMLAYLCVLNNPMDDLRLRRIINTPARGIGNTTMERVRGLAAQQGVTLFEIVRNADLFPELRTAAKKLMLFADMIDGLRKAGGTLALPEFYDEVIERSGYVRALEEKNDIESRGRIENVQELKSNILGFLAGEPEDPTLSGFLNEIALYTDLDSLGEEDNAVTLMTIHSAKGLEFPAVYVVGMEDEVFPGRSAVTRFGDHRDVVDQEELEEERRLCYVAMTRAKEKLTLTNCRQRTLYGRTSPANASLFLDEIPEENMRWLSKPEPRGLREEGFGSFGDLGSYGGGYGSARSEQSRSVPVQTRGAAAGRTAAPARPMLQLAQGDRVEHRSFGQGTVLSLKPMGGDVLAEVAFDGADRPRKLMLKAAGVHMKKL